MCFLLCYLLLFRDVFAFFSKVGAEERPPWKNLLRGSQHTDDHVGEATAFAARVRWQLYRLRLFDPTCGFTFTFYDNTSLSFCVLCLLTVP